jgi:hypothetical protein
VVTAPKCAAITTAAVATVININNITINDNYYDIINNISSSIVTMTGMAMVTVMVVAVPRP